MMLHSPRLFNAIVYGWLVLLSTPTFAVDFNVTPTYLRSVAKPPTLNQTLFTINGTVSNATMIKPCTVFRKMIHTQRSTGTNQTKASPHEVWVCEISLEDRVAHNTRFMVEIEGLPQSFLESIGVKSGITTLFSPSAFIQDDRIVFSKNAMPIVGGISTQNQRQLAPRTTGERTILFVRVIAPDGSTTPSQNDISNKAFGTFGEIESLRTGFTRCSYNQLLMSPARHSLANNGVIDVSISQTVQGTSDITVWNAAETALLAKLNVRDLGTLFDHVVYCLPSGTTGFLAYAYMASWRAVFSDSWCLYPGVLMHEFGHNLNLGHSSEIMGEYEDNTCQMGGNHWPQCFNGAKSFQLGWYTSRTQTINLLTTSTMNPMSFTLVGTSDYQNPNNDPSALVTLKLETGHEDYYVAFNRKIGINAGVGEYGDQVLITKQNDGGENSRLISHLSSTNSLWLTTVSIGSSFYDIKIDVNAITLNTNPGKAVVTISRTLSNVSLSSSPLYGGSGGSDFSAVCPSGSKVKSISGSGDGTIGSLIMFCDNGSILGQIGIGGGANVIGQDCSSGFSGAAVTYGTYVGKIEPICGSTKLSAVGSGQGQSTSFTCPGNQKLVGIRGKSGLLLDSISFLCADFPEAVSDMYGGTGGSYYYSQKCPPGKKITNMSGRGGAWVDQLVAQCDDGSYLGPVGGTGGSQVVANACTGGYTGGTITYGSFVGKVSLVCSSSGSGTQIGSGFSNGSGQTANFQCPTNQVIIGIRGKASDYVDSVSFICGSIAVLAAPTVAPIQPSMKPSTKPSVKAPTTPIISSSFRLTKGPIRSMLGQCIDVYASNFVSGVQLQMWDCNGSNAQLWSRPNSTDLRLRTSNNLCMDAAGNPIAGGPVLIQPCSTSLSQQWIFDGRNLRPKYNTGMCLNINGGVTYNGAKLIVWPCDNASNSAWSEYSLSNTYGKPDSSSAFKHQLCPVGSKLTTLPGRGGLWVDQISGICDDAAKTTIGPFGGSGGSAVTMNCGTAGFIGMNVTNGSYVGKMAGKCSGLIKCNSVGAGLSSGSGSTSGFQLSGNQRIIGLHVQSGQYVNAISFLYAKAA